jgi:hypothetical protein
MKSLIYIMTLHSASLLLSFAEKDNDKWLGLIIPEFKISGVGPEVLHSLSEAINEIKEDEGGLVRTIYDERVAENAITQEFTLRNITVEQLISIIAIQLKASWTHYSGLIMFDGNYPNEQFPFNMDEGMLRLFGIEYNEDGDQNLKNLVIKIQKMGSLLEIADFEFSGLRQDLYLLDATRREVQYFKSLISILERGFSITK